MRKKTTFFSNLQPSIVFLLVAVLIGGVVRLSQVLASPLPLNDGGMFYTMTRDLLENAFRLPQAISYNNLDLPFAYPPLAFYLAGGLSSLFGWDLLDILRLLPAVFTVLAIPAFYLLARDLLKDEFQLILATFIFTFIPASFDWLIMGGGLTRSTAFFLALLSLFTIQRLYTRPQKRYIFWTALLSALTILTHPETALHTAASALLFFLFLGRNRSGLLRSLAVAGLTILLVSPWLGVVLVRHGLQPFLAAGQTGWHGIGAVLSLFQFDLTHEYGLQSIAVLALLGLFWQLAHRKFLLPAWLVLIYFSEPRSAPLYLSPILALLAAYSLQRILALLQPRSPAGAGEPDPFRPPLARIAFGLLLAQWIFSSFYTSMLIVRTTSLAAADRQAFEWVAANTPTHSRFLVITGLPPLSDPVAEWFPALTGRVSLATVQGLEWDDSRDFYERVEISQELQDCFVQAPACLEAWLAENPLEVEYIFFRVPPGTWENGQAGYHAALPEMLVASGDYQPVYDSEGITILMAK